MLEAATPFLHVPKHCIEQALVDVQVTTLELSLKNYKSLIDGGYDSKFKTYERFVKTQIPGQINSFMASDKVDKYFKCKETADFHCCYECMNAYCMENCVPGTKEECKSGWATRDMDKCPRVEFELGMLDPGRIPNATFILTDAKGFYGDIAATWGIDESWIKFGRRLVRPNNGCQYDKPGHYEECIDANFNWFRNYPLENDATIEVYNPKKIIGDSLPMANDMLSRFQVLREFADYDEMMLVSDVVDATSLPGFSAEEAVSSMSKIVEKADEIEKAEREEFILGFIMGFLFFIPFVGEAAAAGMTTTRALLRLIGTAGDAGVMIYDVVQDPQNAFMSVFGFLTGAGVGRSGFRKAADARRSMSTKELDGLGNIKLKLEREQNIRVMSCPV